jgi:Domain of unknown function (DUF4157)
MWERPDPARAKPNPPSAAVMQRCGDHRCLPGGCTRGQRPGLLADEVAHILPRALGGATAAPSAGGGIPASAWQASRGTGQRLAPSTRGLLEPFFGADFGDVRLHTDAVSTREAAALAYTAGSDIVFAPGRYQPDGDLGLRLLAHELTHVVQQRRGAVGAQAQRPGAPGLDPAEREAEGMADRIGSAPGRTGATLGYKEFTDYADCMRIMGSAAREFCDREVLGLLPPVVPGVSLADRPLAERLELKVHKAVLGPDVTAAVGRFFGPAPAVAPPIPAGQKLVLGTSVEPQYQNGIRAVGAFVLDQISRAKPPGQAILPPDRTFNMAIQATGHVFRLTRLGTSTLMIEQIGPIMAAPVAVPDAQVQPGTLTIGKRRFRLAKGWRTNDVARLTAGLEAMPAALLPPAGTEFRREAVMVCTKAEIAADTCDPAWAGMHRYDTKAKPPRHTITLYDGAFIENARRDGTWPVLHTIIAHEVGHALDYEDLRRGRQAAFKTPGTTAQHTAATLAVRSPSGRRLKESAKTTPGMILFDVDENAASKKGAYRTAVLADGMQADPAGKLAHGITDYSERNWTENFAENFSIYAADPELLSWLRPNVFSYFQRSFPAGGAS